MININLYGFFIALGILAGVLVVEKLQKKLSVISYQLSVVDVLPWLLIPGIIGARLYHVVDYWKYYCKNLIRIFYIWEGGMGIFGGILGAIVGLWIFLKFKKFKGLKFNQVFLSLLDLGAAGLSIGQAIGRWGNYFNQELYGLPTNLFWGIYIGPENRLAGFENFTHFHPLFLYESLGCFIIFLILIKKTSILKIKNKISKTPIRQAQGKHIKNQKLLKEGEIFFLYLLLYSFLRFWLEFLRIEGWTLRVPLSVNYVRVNQLVSLGLMLISGLAIYKKSVKIKT